MVKNKNKAELNDYSTSVGRVKVIVLIGGVALTRPYRCEIKTLEIKQNSIGTDRVNAKYA
ncbi:MAG: hypothetical protein GY799_23420 [Desulfobulbaceae bacterium]|nr:hypothetical protein [Desulfobulbaceae bacterium]